MVHLAVTGVMLLGLGLALWRLPPLHPVQLWLAAWSVSLFLYSLHLLPYRSIGFLTGALILGATGGFTAGVLLVERMLADAARRHARPPSIAADGPPVKLAARLLLAGAAALLLAFLVQAVANYGVGNTIVSSSSVRRAIEAGEFAITIKYVYFAIAAVPLTIVAAHLSEGREQRGWYVATAAAAGSVYFTTARGAIWLAAGSVLFALALLQGRELRLRRVLYAGAALAGLAVILLAAAGTLVGKSFKDSDLALIRTPFSEHSYLGPLGVPYQYASASIPALDIEVKMEGTWGHARGCATLAPACRVLRKLGAPTRPEPSLRPFTASPVRWNLYTALDRPLVDGGAALAVPTIFLLGLIVGLAWVAVSTGWPGGVFAYALVGPAILFAPAANFAATEHFLGALFLGGVSLQLGRYVARRRFQPSRV